MSVRSELRPMTDAEREIARALDTSSLAAILGEGCLTAVLAGVVGLFAGAIVDVIVSELFRLPGGPWMTHGMITFGLLGVAWALWTVWKSHRKQTTELRDDIEGAIVEVLSVEAFIAWEERDSVPAFLFDVAEASQLSVRGEALVELVRAKKFPCRSFGLVRLPATRRLLSVDPRGEYLPPRA